ncbi:hypothetical protein [Arthrobacter sp. HLT1-21]
MKLDWAPKHDQRSRDYPVREILGREGLGQPQSFWPNGPVMHQGPDGACVGYAFTAAVAAEPLPRLVEHEAEDLADFAERAFTLAKTLDEFPGEDTPGTSVVAGAKAMQMLGYIKGYRWAFGHEDVIDALCYAGPVVLGLYWTTGMQKPVNGLMSLDGERIGGHCVTAVAYASRLSATDSRPAIMIQNSWGASWGAFGHAWLLVSDLITLLQRQGEACVIIK